MRPLLPGGPGCAVMSPAAPRSPRSTVPTGFLSRRCPTRRAPPSSARSRAGTGWTPGIRSWHSRAGFRSPSVSSRRASPPAARSPADVLAGQLAATEGRLHHLEYDDLSVRRSLAVAHDALRASDREADRDAARALGRIGVLDLPGYGAPLLAHLLGTDERRAEAALDRLVDVALLEETAYGRYSPHDLVRDFARETARREGAAETDRVAADLALRWYSAVAARAFEAVVAPGAEREDRLRETPSQPGTHRADVAAVAAFGSAQAATDWLGLELENMVALVERHADTSAHVPLLVRRLASHLQRRGRVTELEVLVRAALRGARRLVDAPAEAYALVDLAGLHFLKGHGNDALALLDEALEIWRRLGHLSCLCRGLNNRALLLESLGRYEETGEALRQCLEYTRVLNDPMQEAITYSNLGNLYEHTDPRAAIGHHRRSLEIGERIGHIVVRHSAHCNIGFAHLTLGEPDAALPYFEESLRVLGGHGHWQGESQTRLGLVRALRGRGRRTGPRASARRCWRSPPVMATATPGGSRSTSAACSSGRRVTPRRPDGSGRPPSPRWTGRTVRWPGSSGNCWRRGARRVSDPRGARGRRGRPRAVRTTSFRVRVALDDARRERNPNRRLAERQPHRQVCGLLDRRHHRGRLLVRAVHDDLVVLEEDQLGGEARTGAAQRGEHQQSPVRRAALDDEVAREAAAGTGVGGGVSRHPLLGLPGRRRRAVLLRNARLLRRVVRGTGGRR
ncbi:tetratricopeptide repeat protein [Streptomyces sp. T1317-0309]|nr:tetratricopeptide repeat protein [Streptomyces sp. T1317-0309]